MINLTVYGRLGRDAEVRQTQGGTATCSLRIAANYGRKDQSGTQG